ncbi:p-cumate dioxygenase (plasmid) [Pseudonocardia sp. EC080610-09]|uniref:aromatic ring-hydroxylating oxygenase subunit alpha n=1 Tax=unclassified Pseudonocardia TaxID=2619320 RepID=UPI0007061BE0|nr:MULTISPECIES: aromatic ring-hydroxylating dioxygenase subunit alpha [unclassified Pseudonocardia]ALL79308.1 p-cumate dioxygenase [Pseudonocardia sp. EC080610-09]ALL85279.1 p-cumate dioxygenase [Pseudonocardia sp. EC080619-01]
MSQSARTPGYIIDDREMPRFRVNREVMVAPDVFARERDHIFSTCWLYLGHESELRKPNDFRTRNVAGRPLIFFRDSRGQIRVWVNSCPHRGAILCREDKGNARFMTCFYHGWSFSNAGKLVSLPDDASYGPDFDRPGLAAPAQVDSYRGFVFVCFDPEAPDLRTYLAGATEFLDLVCDQSAVGMQVLEGTHEYSVNANWKLLTENSFDGYHAVTTHQRYFEMAVAARAGRDDTAARERAQGSSALLGQSRSADLGNGHAVTMGAPSTGSIFGRPLSEAGQTERNRRFAEFAETYGEAWVERMQGTRNLVIFPNLVVIDLVMGVVIRKIDPVAPDYMEVSAWHLAPPEEGAELHRQRLDNFLTFWGPGGLASPDDVEALETCQRSFAARRELPWSDISRGMNKDRPSGSDEWQMRTWWRRWNELVNSETLPDEPHDELDGVFAGRRADTSAAPVA